MDIERNHGRLYLFIVYMIWTKRAGANLPAFMQLIKKIKINAKATPSKKNLKTQFNVLKIKLM